ncbi:hypothetical protein DDE19_22115 [Micromonospora ureilytica]|uniref:Aminoglycoside phosphotransferase domain-containing protein n=1 Tax=Micromonospora ureilytica TaxID=709868 RepID=A0A3N9XPM8_9ACTN|nr:hypothetical protein [Micromonospora ureilytica]RQX14749.1 hypothetical protein DDE19_22115 [Micromonospora ureilytica]
MTTRVGPATDPRSRVDGLGWVSRAVFPDDRVGLTVDGAPPAGHQVVARYAVVPSVARARFLVPLGAPRAGAASLLAYNALRPPKVRALRAVLGGLARFGRVGLAPFPTLTVSVPAGVPAAELLLSERLSADLGDTPLLAAFGVRPPDPNGKPTLQLFSADGRPRGYAKIGWNDATRALVSAEAAALRALRAVVGVADHPTPPRLLTETSWAGQVVAVIEPLPPAVRGVPVDDPPRIAALLAVARRGGPAGTPRPLVDSTFLHRLADQAGRAAATERAGARAVAAVSALARRHGDTSVEFGHWHGDWVPWNLGWHAGRLVAWDWEHSGPDVPVGFDLAHDAFQRALVLRGEPADAAASAVDGYLSRHGERLGLDAAQRRLVADAYLVEMWLRTWRLADAGAGWNAALHPALLDVIEKRHSG